MTQPTPKEQNKEQKILKIQEFVEKLGSVEKAKEALDTLAKIRKAA